MDNDEILEILKTTSELEKNLHSFYGLYAAAFKEDRHLWEMLSQDAEGHHASIVTISQYAQEGKFPGDFSHPYIEDLKKAAGHINKYLSLYAQNMPDKKNAYMRAYDIASGVHAAYLRGIMDTAESMEMTPGSYNIFLKLCSDTKDNAARIKKTLESTESI